MCFATIEQKERTLNGAYVYTQCLWKGSQGSDCLKLLGRGFGEKDLHSSCFGGEPPKNKTKQQQRA